MIFWTLAPQQSQSTPVWTDDVLRTLEQVREAKGLSWQDPSSHYVGRNPHLINWDGDCGDLLLQTTRPQRPGFHDSQFRNAERVYAALEEDLDFLQRSLTASGSHLLSSVPEISTEERRVALLQIRGQIYKRPNTYYRGVRSHNQVYPYRNHLTLAELNNFVLDMRRSDVTLWLWTSDHGKRFLLRKEHSRKEAFKLVNGFISHKANNIYLSVWQEVGVPFSHKWQYLGVIGAPDWSKLKEYKINQSDQRRYRLHDYDILSSSVFQAKAASG